MGVVAIETFPSFHQTIRKLDQVLSKLEPKPSFSLEEVLLGKSHGERFNDPEITQPLCTAIQVAIVDLLAEWGVDPVVAVGHSSGEIAAAVQNPFSSLDFYMSMHTKTGRRQH